MYIGCEKLKAAVLDVVFTTYIYNHWLTQKYSELWLVRYNGLVWSNIALLQLLPSYIHDPCSAHTKCLYLMIFPHFTDKILGIQEKQGENIKPSDQIFLLWYREIILMIVCNILETTSTMVNDQPTMKIRILRKRIQILSQICFIWIFVVGETEFWYLLLWFDFVH